MTSLYHKKCLGLHLEPCLHGKSAAEPTHAARQRSHRQEDISELEMFASGLNDANPSLRRGGLFGTPSFRSSKEERAKSGKDERGKFEIFGENFEGTLDQYEDDILAGLAETEYRGMITDEYERLASDSLDVTKGLDDPSVELMIENLLELDEATRHQLALIDDLDETSFFHDMALPEEAILGPSRWWHRPASYAQALLWWVSRGRLQFGQGRAQFGEAQRIQAAETQWPWLLCRTLALLG
mmetsp:Transcript_77923/g.143142  ORF Transcript_77923/g.143142 Transcript_77923/m.143142 type:complete len:241 (-) Transcript_77923:112-834(-)